MWQDYYTSGRMLVKMAEAIGRVVLAGRELTRLAGLVSLGTASPHSRAFHLLRNTEEKCRVLF